MMDNLIGIAIRLSFMYLYALTLLRLSGKQSMSSLSAMDFIVGLIIGDLFDDVIWAEIPVIQGVVGLATVILVHVLVTFAASKNKFVYHLFSPPPSLVIKQGMLQREVMQKERTNTEAVLSEMRLNGEDRLDEVKEARWESNGRMSILKKESSKPVKKGERRLFS